METDLFELEQYTALISRRYSTLVTPVFMNCKDSKKCSIVLAVCEESSRKISPLDINIKEVAKFAGVSVGALYKYFTNRENLLSFTVFFVRDYMLDVMQQSTEALSELPFTEALYYYVAGAASWSDTERTLALFFYKAVYAGESELQDDLVLPLSRAFKHCIHRLIENAVKKQEIELHLDVEAAATVLYQSLVPIADSLCYPELQNYFFPNGLSDADIRQLIDSHCKSIGLLL